MLNIQEKKQETLGLLDAIINLLEELHSVSFNISGTLPSNYSAGVTDNDAFGYLFDVLKSLNGGTQEVLDFIVNILEKLMPVMEISVKAMLLANIKSEINCGSDPIIPNKFREFYYNSDYALYRNKHWKSVGDDTTSEIGFNWTDTKVMQIINAEKGEGIKLNIGAIDYLDKLKYNPTADGGDLLYFGILPEQSPFSLCRAIDMDAFIWFCMHKAKFYNAFQTGGIDSSATVNNLIEHFSSAERDDVSVFKIVDEEPVQPIEDYDITGTDDDKEKYLFSLYDFFYVKPITDGVSLKNVACGTAVKYRGNNTIAICTKVKVSNRDGNTVTSMAQFMPCTDSYQGAMWYIDSWCYHGKGLLVTATSNKRVRNHNKLYEGEDTDKSDDDIEDENDNELRAYAHPRDYEKEFPIFKLEYEAMTSGKSAIPSKKGYDTKSYGSATSRNTADLVFKILPKPLIIYPQMSTNRFQQFFIANKVTFDSYGNKSRKGHFSCYIDPSFVSTYNRVAETTISKEPQAVTSITDSVKAVTYPVKETYPNGPQADTDYIITPQNPATTPSVTNTTVTANCEPCFFNFDTGEMQEFVGQKTPDGFSSCWRYRVLNGKQFNDIAYRTDVNNGMSANNYIGWLVVNTTGKYQLYMLNDEETGKPHLPQECLYPCYAPSTIYQFNYQYVMGMQLFNAKQILCSALDFTLGLNLSLELGLTEKQGLDRQRIIEIIKNMCEVDSSSVSDCFYSFSNTKFDSMLNESDRKRHNGYQFKGGDNQVHKVDRTALKSVLNSYDADATLNERTNTLKRAITEASVSIEVTPDTPDEVNFATGINSEFLETLIRNLTISMVSSLLTPKVIMLFTVNKRLMGDYSEYESIEDFLRANQAIVISLVKHIRDLILEELLAFVMDKLKVIISLWSTALLREYYEKIARILRLMKEDCLNSIPSWTKQRVLDTEIPIVNYADIDNNQAPVTEHCE